MDNIITSGIINVDDISLDTFRSIIWAADNAQAEDGDIEKLIHLSDGSFFYTGSGGYLFCHSSEKPEIDYESAFSDEEFITWDDAFNLWRKDLKNKDTKQILKELLLPLEEM